jgi:hypothetical protein
MHAWRTMYLTPPMKTHNRRPKGQGTCCSSPCQPKCFPHSDWLHACGRWWRVTPGMQWCGGTSNIGTNDIHIYICIYTIIQWIQTISIRDWSINLSNSPNDNDDIINDVVFFRQHPWSKINLWPHYLQWYDMMIWV